MNALDRLAEQAPDALHAHLAGTAEPASDSGIVLVTTTCWSGESVMRCDGLAREHRVGRARRDTLGAPAFMIAMAALVSVPRGVDDVVDDDGLLAADVADDVHHLGDVGRRAPLVDDREARAEALARTRARARRRRRPATRRP